MSFDLTFAANQKRALASQLMRDRCNLIAGVITDDGFGGQVEDWSSPSTVASNQPCYYTETLTPDQQDQVNRRGLTVEAAIFIPATLVAVEGQRIVLTAVDGFHSGTYEIRGLTGYTDEVTRTALVGKIT